MQTLKRELRGKNTHLQQCVIFRQLPFLVVNNFNNLYHFWKTFGAVK